MYSVLSEKIEFEPRQQFTFSNFKRLSSVITDAFARVRTHSSQIDRVRMRSNACELVGENATLQYLGVLQRH